MTGKRVNAGRYADAYSYLYGGGIEPEKYGAIDFWTYGFSDMMANLNRGAFAKWMVASLLGVRPDPRDVLREYDFKILAKSGHVSVYVKATARMQPWGPTRSYSFDGLKPDRILSGGKKYLGVRDFWADFYVFCEHTLESDDGWDAFNLDQWRFWVLRNKDLASEEKRHGDEHLLSITLSRVKAVYKGLQKRYDLPAEVKAPALKKVIAILAAKLGKD